MRTQFVSAGKQFVAIGSRLAAFLPTVVLSSPVVARQEDHMFERLVIRTVAFGLSGFVTLSILGALGTTADTRHEQACLAYAGSIGPIQHVVVTGQRLRPS